jgi:L-asparaginase/Glu-tRNA(Gln) amidotransferase subunit D
MISVWGIRLACGEDLIRKRVLVKDPVPVVLIGAMIPLGFEGSDGLQNLTESLLAIQLFAPGFYLVMHGQVFPVDRVRKDHADSRFAPKP